MKAIVDQETCIGCGICPEICPEVFRLNEEQLAETIVDEVPADLEEKAKEAAEACPVDAITVR